MDPVVHRLSTAVIGLLDTRQRVLIGIDGPDAAGKTSLADRLAGNVGAASVRASIDAFHNPSSVRRRRGALSPLGYYRDSFDYRALTQELLMPFASGAARVTTAWYDHRRDVSTKIETDVPARAVLVFDGVFLLRQEVREFWTLAVYLTVTPEETLRRGLLRDGGSAPIGEVERRYLWRYLPGQALYREEVDPAAFADVLVDNTDVARPRVVRWPNTDPA